MVTTGVWRPYYPPASPPDCSLSLQLKAHICGTGDPKSSTASGHHSANHLVECELGYIRVYAIEEARRAINYSRSGIARVVYTGVARTGTSVRESWEMLHLDLSPYTLAARRYRDNLASDTSWMQLTRLSVLFCAVLGYGTRLLLVFLSAVADVFRL